MDKESIVTVKGVATELKKVAVWSLLRVLNTEIRGNNRLHSMFYLAQFFKDFFGVSFSDYKITSYGFLTSKELNDILFSLEVAGAIKLDIKVIGLEDNKVHCFVIRPMGEIDQI